MVSAALRMADTGSRSRSHPINKLESICKQLALGTASIEHLLKDISFDRAGAYSLREETIQALDLILTKCSRYILARSQLLPFLLATSTTLSAEALDFTMLSLVTFWRLLGLVSRVSGPASPDCWLVPI